MLQKECPKVISLLSLLRSYTANDTSTWTLKFMPVRISDGHELPAAFTTRSFTQFRRRRILLHGSPRSSAMSFLVRFFYFVSRLRIHHLHCTSILDSLSLFSATVSLFLRLSCSLSIRCPQTHSGRCSLSSETRPERSVVSVLLIDVGRSGSDRRG